MICIPKLALEIQDLSLPATVLSPRLDNTYIYRFWPTRSYVENGMVLKTPICIGITYRIVGTGISLRIEKNGALQYNS